MKDFSYNWKDVKSPGKTEKISRLRCRRGSDLRTVTRPVGAHGQLQLGRYSLAKTQRR
jgi:hypothetical protein